MRLHDNTVSLDYLSTIIIYHTSYQKSIGKSTSFGGLCKVEAKAKRINVLLGYVRAYFTASSRDIAFPLATSS
jgi:hypothetical protein